MMKSHIPFFAVLLLLPSCLNPPPLREEPWSRIGKGSQQIGVSTGWAEYKADVSARGKSGALAPGGIPDIGTDTADLDPRYGGAIKYSYFLADNFSLGGIAEVRSFSADPIMPLTALLDPDPFETFHFIIAPRYFFKPLGGDMKRFKPFIGLDLAYIPSVKFDRINVVYPASTGIPSEVISASGDSYWTLAPLAGMSWLVRDNLTLDFGAFYEFPIDEADASVAFTNLGNAEADVRVEPRGIIGFVGMSYFF